MAFSRRRPCTSACLATGVLAFARHGTCALVGFMLRRVPCRVSVTQHLCRSTFAAGVLPPSRSVRRPACARAVLLRCRCWQNPPGIRQGGLFLAVANFLGALSEARPACLGNRSPHAGRCYYPVPSRPAPGSAACARKGPFDFGWRLLVGQAPAFTRGG